MRNAVDPPRLDPEPSRWPLLVRRIAILVLSVAFVVSIGLLAGHVHWPDAYGYTCNGKCLVTHMLESYRLLEGGTLPEAALFLCLWLWPLVLGWLFSPRMWTGPARDRIRPMGDG